MAHIIPMEHKQIAYVSYNPEDQSLIVTYYRGAPSTHLSIDMEQFETLLKSSNKVDGLSKLLSGHKSAEYLPRK